MIGFGFRVQQRGLWEPLLNSQDPNLIGAYEFWLVCRACCFMGFFSPSWPENDVAVEKSRGLGMLGTFEERVYLPLVSREWRNGVQL